MKITEHLQKAESTLFSLEILPPLRGKSINDLYKVLDPLMEFNPPFIDVTYHREEILYKKRSDGFIEQIPKRKRPGTVGICAAIHNRYKVDTVPHLVCGGFTKGETEDALFSLHYLEIQNVMVLRGDALKSEVTFVPSEGGHNYASDLVKQIKDMNEGKFLFEETANEMSTDFCIGVAAYPEKHFESPNLSTDLKNLKKKVDMGADYIVTQMFYDNQKYFKFLDMCKEEGINVPIIPGLKPITTKGQILALPPRFHIDIPEELSNEISKAKDNAAAKQIGVEWAVQQSRELMEYGVPCLHFYSMSRSEAVTAIAREIF
ncbi:MAG: methylenetetrahydrofolate reductase [NAD(P)H] [Chitinophagales bacterium]|nr:methylenetetrahydrofolate reductase [NAD(P)H] [Chitinophagales bacterium]